MYLIELNKLGNVYKIVPDPARGLGGIYVNAIPISIETMIANGTIEEHLDTQNKKYYIIKGEN